MGNVTFSHLCILIIRMVHNINSSDLDMGRRPKLKSDEVFVCNPIGNEIIQGIENGSFCDSEFSRKFFGLWPPVFLLWSISMGHEHNIPIIFMHWRAKYRVWTSSFTPRHYAWDTRWSKKNPLSPDRMQLFATGSCLRSVVKQGVRWACTGVWIRVGLLSNVTFCHCLTYIMSSRVAIFIFSYRSFCSEASL